MMLEVYHRKGMFSFRESLSQHGERGPKGGIALSQVSFQDGIPAGALLLT